MLQAAPHPNSPHQQLQAIRGDLLACLVKAEFPLTELQHASNTTEFHRLQRQLRRLGYHARFFKREDDGRVDVLFTVLDAA